MIFSSKNKRKQGPHVGVIMGSISDREVMMQATEVLQEFEVPCEMRIVSAHRTPEWMQEYAQTAEERGLEVIIAGAGGAAHLPGMVAAHTLLPVIGVPISLPNLAGWDSLLSIVSMPKGVPVATVALDGAANAALLALRILALHDPKILQALEDYRHQQAQQSRKNDAQLLENLH